MEGNRKYIPIIMGLTLAFGVFVGSKLNFNDSTEKIFATNSKKDKLNRLIDYIDYEYVDDVNTDSIVDVTVNGILENLDPHSVYIPVDEYEDNADDLRGNFVGIGVSFYVYNDTIAVIRAIEGGPAERAGIQGGDRILFADGRKLFGETIDRDSITKYLKGEINSKVKLKVFRPEEDELMEVTVKRKRVPLVSVDASYPITDDLGYIKVNRFSETTYAEFHQALENLRGQGMTKLILDLRNNPGGYVSTAQQIADEFLEEDKLVLITRNKNGEESRTYATDSGDFEEGRIYVLINENSAYYREYEDRYRNGELRSADSIKVADSLRFITPGGKVVYGGGGIIPDIFVPKDTSIENETLAYVTRSGFMSYFIFEHLEEDRSLYEAMTLEEFVRDFEASDELADEFIAYSRFEDARIDISEYYQELKQALKANIAQQLFDSNAYERILNQNDEMILKVMQLDSGQGASTADY